MPTKISFKTGLKISSPVILLVLNACGARPGGMGGAGGPSLGEIQSAQLFRVQEQIALNANAIDLPPQDGGGTSSSASSTSSDSSTANSSSSDTSSSATSSSDSTSSSTSSDTSSSVVSSSSTSSSSSSSDSSVISSSSSAVSSSSATSSSSVSSSSSSSTTSSSSSTTSSSSTSSSSSSSENSSSSSSSASSDDNDDNYHGTHKIFIRRACWDRPRDWPTVKRADSKALFALKSANQKYRYHTLTLRGSDFYRKTPTIEVSDAEYRAAHWLEVCQTDSKDRCKAGRDGDFEFTPGLIVEKVGSTKDGKTVSKLPYRPEEIKLLNKISSKNPVEIIVENIGQYYGRQREQIRADYCDVVYKVSSPLALDFSGKGFLPGKQSQGPTFDIDADGHKEKMSSLGNTAGLLALDLNKNGLIDDGKELFGDATWIASKNANATNGFEALAQYDLNNDQIIDNRDLIYKDLRIWIDLNKNGVSEASELFTLEEAGVAEIDLKYIDGSDFDIFGNNALQRSIFRTPSGLTHYIADIWFLTESAGE